MMYVHAMILIVYYLNCHQVTPIPPPLLPTVHKLTTQLTVLSQPRHLDAISRKLKLLLTDLDRISNAHSKESKGRQGQDANAQVESTPGQALELQEQILGRLNRLSPHLPQIPLILARLRTLSALHSSATSFDATVASLEKEQLQTSRALEDLTRAVEGVENSIQANNTVIKQNVTSIEQRVDDILQRMGDLAHGQ
jgi:nuclear migration protein JNM1